MTQQQVKHRKKPLPAVEKAFRDAARAVIKRNELDQEVDALVNTGDQQIDEEVMEVAESRFDVAERLREVLDEIKQARDSVHKQQLKEDKKELEYEMRCLPDLGATFDDWLALSEEEREEKRGVGRPKLPMEVEVIRARSHANEKLEEYHQIAEENGNPRSKNAPDHCHPMDESTMVEVYSETVRNMGKKPADSLTVLDRDIRLLDERIEYIESGQAQRDREEKAEQAKLSSKGKPMGRPFEPLDDQLVRFKQEREVLEEKRREIEAGLGPVDRVERQVKLIQDEVMAVRKRIREAGWNPRKDDPDEMPHGEDLIALEEQAQRLRQYRDHIKQATASNNRLAQERLQSMQKAIREDELDRQKSRTQKIHGEHAKDKTREGLENSLLSSLADEVSQASS